MNYPKLVTWLAKEEEWRHRPQIPSVKDRLQVGVLDKPQDIALAIFSAKVQEGAQKETINRASGPRLSNEVVEFGLGASMTLKRSSTPSTSKGSRLRMDCLAGRVLTRCKRLSE